MSGSTPKLRIMSGTFSSKYSDGQRAAVVAAFVDRGITAPAVVELASAGNLEHDGEQLAPFEMPASTVRSLARDARRRRSGAMRAELANAAPADALEDLRRRLVSAIDHELRQVERRQSAGKAVKGAGEELRQLARAYRELAARTGPTGSRPPVPDAKVNGVRDGGVTRGGIAGPLLADHRASGSPSAWPTPLASEPSVADTSDTPDEGAPDDDGSPAALARELVAQFEAGEEIRRDEAGPMRGGRVPIAGSAPTRIVEPDAFDHSRLAAEDVTAIERSERGRL
jgi:hypothetical protein